MINNDELASQTINFIDLVHDLDIVTGLFNNKRKITNNKRKITNNKRKITNNKRKISNCTSYKNIYPLCPTKTLSS